MPREDESRVFLSGRKLAAVAVGALASVAIAASTASTLVFFLVGGSNAVRMDVPLPLPAPLVFVVGLVLYVVSARMFFDEDVELGAIPKTVSGKLGERSDRRFQRYVASRRRKLVEEVPWLRWHAAKVLSGELIDEGSVPRLARAVGDGLAMGIVEIDWKIFDASDDVLADASKLRQWQLEAESQRKDIEAVCAIWEHALHGLLLDSRHAVFQVEEFHALGRDIGVDTMLSSYADGVELEAHNRLSELIP